MVKCREWHTRGTGSNHVWDPFIYLINTLMQSKQDIKKGRLCMQGWGGGGGGGSDQKG